MKKSFLILAITGFMFIGLPEILAQTTQPAKGQNLETDSLKLNKKEIYILGTFHFREHDFKKYPQDINKEIRKAINYKPDIVCVEWMDKSEKLDAYNIDYTKNINDLIEKMKLDTVKATLIIDSIYKELSKNPDSYENRAKLANYLYITKDYINACYQWYLIENSVKDRVKLKTLLPEDINTLRLSLYGDAGNQKREIVEIAFPIAKSLAHEKIYSIDYRHEQNEYGLYANAFTNRFQSKYGYDPMEKKTEPLLKTMSEWLESDRLNNTSTYYEKLNSDEFESQLFAYYFDMYVSYCNDSDYRKWHELQLEKRNWKVFELLINAINESNAKKTFVLVGTTHKIFLDRYLKESNIFKIVGYNELK